jgi:hypothetical protein
MTFYDYEISRRIDVSILEGSHYSNELSVRGNDRDWVQGTFSSLKEVIDATRPQDNLILKHKQIVLHVIAIGVGTLVYMVLNFLIFRHFPYDATKIPTNILTALLDFYRSNRFLYYAIFYLVSVFLMWLEGMFTLAYPVYYWLMKLWPEIEFDFGPEHMNKHKIRRHRIWIIASLVLIPILVNIASHFIVR